MARLVARTAPITNLLLDRLPAKDRAHLLARCERVVLASSKTLAEPGQPIRHVYFPTGSLISLLTPGGGLMSLQIALTGNEGVYGVGLALGVDFSRGQATVQAGGPAWRIGAAAFRSELARSPALRKGVHKYVYLLSYTRGGVVILDRAGLERASCDCYQKDRDAYQHIFGSA